MAYEEPTYQINEPASGVKFYNGSPIIGVASELSGSVDIQASVGLIIQASAALSASTDTAGTIRKINLGQSLLSVDGAQVTASIEILLALVILSINSNTAVSGTKIALSSSAMDANGSVAATVTAIKQATSAPSVATTATVVGTKIVPATSSISGMNVVVAVGKEFLYAAASIAAQCSFSVSDILRITPSVRYPGSFVAQIILDNRPLTAQNRKFDYSVAQPKIEKINWNSKKSRYFKSQTTGKATFKLSWDWLPSKRKDTLDKREARDYIKDIANDLDSHVLKLISYGENPEDLPIETSYNVLIKSYNEDIIRRDLVNDIYFYTCNIEMEEV